MGKDQRGWVGCSRFRVLCPHSPSHRLVYPRRRVAWCQGLSVACVHFVNRACHHRPRSSSTLIHSSHARFCVGKSIGSLLCFWSVAVGVGVTAHLPLVGCMGRFSRPFFWALGSSLLPCLLRFSKACGLSWVSSYS